MELALDRGLGWPAPAPPAPAGWLAPPRLARSGSSGSSSSISGSSAPAGSDPVQFKTISRQFKTISPPRPRLAFCVYRARAQIMNFP